MAAIAEVNNFLSLLREIAGNKGSHIWLEECGDLVVGQFPHGSFRFDFAAERFIEINSEPLSKRKETISLLGSSKKIHKKYLIETSEKEIIVGSATQLLLVGLDVIETMKPGTLDKLSKMKRRTKRPVAKNRFDLYDTEHPESHSEYIASGYFVATNNSAAESKGILKRAIEAAGLSRDMFSFREQ